MLFRLPICTCAHGGKERVAKIGHVVPQKHWSNNSEMQAKSEEGVLVSGRTVVKAKGDGIVVATTSRYEILLDWFGGS